MDETVRAGVTNVLDKERGNYAVAVPTNARPRGSVTFSLHGAWKNDRLPEPGDVVLLAQLVRKKAGWRAYDARPLPLSEPL